jgi:hypothetical protein
LAPGEAGSGYHASGAPTTPSPVGVRTRHHLSTTVRWWWLTVWCGRRPGWGWRRCCFFLENGRHVFSRLTASSSWRKWSPCAQSTSSSSNARLSTLCRRVSRITHGESGRRVPNRRHTATRPFTRHGSVVSWSPCVEALYTQRRGHHVFFIHRRVHGTHGDLPDSVSD